MLLIYSDFNYIIRDVTILCKSEDHSHAIQNGLVSLEGVEVLECHDDTFAVHRGGKLNTGLGICFPKLNQISFAKLQYTILAG